MVGEMFMKKNDFFIKNYVINEILIKEIKNLNLSVNELIFLVYFINADSKKLDIQNINLHISYTQEEILSTINMLVEKKLIDLVSKKDEGAKLADFISLDGLNEYLLQIEKQNNTNDKLDIYSVFEKEFGRTISSFEYEIINAWLDKKFSKELILLALKEAVYNGVTNFRYIDKILFEWQKNGIKNKADFDACIKKKKEKKPSEVLFDYDWLADETE